MSNYEIETEAGYREVMKLFNALADSLSKWEAKKIRREEPTKGEMLEFRRDHESVSRESLKKLHPRFPFSDYS